MTNKEIIVRLRTINDNLGSFALEDLIKDLEPYTPVPGDLFKDREGDLYACKTGGRGLVLTQDGSSDNVDPGSTEQIDMIEKDYGPLTKVQF